LKLETILTKSEQELVIQLGHRWLRMGPKKILDENALVFRLAVAIAGDTLNRADLARLTAPKEGK